MYVFNSIAHLSAETTQGRQRWIQTNNRIQFRMPSDAEMK